MSGDVAAGLGLLGAALLTWPAPRARVRARLRFLHPATDRGRSAPAEGPVGARRRRWLLAAAAGLAAGLVIGGGPGLVAGALVAVGADRLMRRSADPAEGMRRSLVHDLPFACDLLAVCLTAGLPVTGALTAVGAAVPGALGGHLGNVAALHRLGAEPRRAWAEVPGELAALGRVVVRAGESGSAINPALRALAAEARAVERAGAEAAVRRAGVWVLAPLGLCFLPAFVCLGVAPLVLGIARDVFGG